MTAAMSALGQKQTSASVAKARLFIPFQPMLVEASPGRRGSTRVRHRPVANLGEKPTAYAALPQAA